MTTILFDAKNCLFRFGMVHFGLTSQTGEHTGALYGMLDLVLRLKKKYPDGRFAMVWDGGGKTWRHEMYPEYKAGRVQDERVRAVLSQTEKLASTMSMIGIPSVSVPCVEADDLLAMAAMKAKRLDHDVVIYSSDCDFYQLLAHDIIFIRNGVEPETRRAVRERFGCHPGQVLAVRALSGDKSDNIPNIRRGIGPKRAADMVMSGLNILDSESTALPSGERETAVRNMKLMRLRTDPAKYPGGPKVRTALSFAMMQLQAGMALPMRVEYGKFLRRLVDLDLAEAIAERHHLYKIQL